MRCRSRTRTAMCCGSGPSRGPGLPAANAV
jgi:hypothetical protein